MQSIVNKLKQFRALAWHEKTILLGTLLLHPLFWLGLRVYGYARFQTWLDRIARPKRAQADPKLDDLIALGRLVNLAARHTPAPATCLSRSLLLRWLLRRRGIASELRIGVQLIQGKLDAHAWVEYAGTPINDAQDVANRYAAFNEPISLEAFTAP